MYDSSWHGYVQMLESINFEETIIQIKKKVIINIVLIKKEYISSDLLLLPQVQYLI